VFFGRKTAQPLRHHGKKLMELARRYCKRLIREVAGNDVMEGESMNPVVHFEMSFDNRERMAKFYRSAFGWQTQMLGEEMGNYVLAHDGTRRDRPQKPGRHQIPTRLRSSASPVSLRLSCPLITAADA
jgi:hypothetical protein